jgi:hypothetical protein
MFLFAPSVGRSIILLSFKNMSGGKVRLELPWPRRDDLQAFSDCAVSSAKQALGCKPGEELFLVEAECFTTRSARVTQRWFGELFASATGPAAVHVNADDLV